MGKACGGRASTTQLPFPLAGKRNARFVPEHEVQLFWFAQKSALRLGLQYTNRDDIFSRLQHAIGDEIDPRVFDPGAGADLLSVDVYGVHALNRAQKNQSASCGNWIRQRYFSAEPDHALVCQAHPVRQIRPEYRPASRSNRRNPEPTSFP